MRIVLTRPVSRGRDLAEALAEAGHQVTHVPLTEIVDGDPFPDPAGFDGVLFTSVNAVVRAPEGAQWPRVGAVGLATAAALAERGIPVDVVGDGGGAELAQAWGDAAGQRLLLPQAAEAHPALAAALEAMGAAPARVAVYGTQPTRTIDTALLEAAEIICFFAPSQVAAFQALGIETSARVWGYGPTTQAAMEGMANFLDALDDVM